MDLFTIDFETYYDKEYSLSLMATEDYVSDPRFQIILVGLKKNNEPVKWFSSRDIRDYRTWLLKQGVDKGAALAHNMPFDGLILQHRLGIVPPLYLDTLCLAQAILKPFHRSISLDSCMKHLTHLGFKKGSEVHNMIGRRLETLTREELTRYAHYCCTDCECEYYLFQDLKKRVPREEIEIIDMTHRMYLEPQFELDQSVLSNVLRDTIDHKEKLLAALPNTVGKPALMSNQKLAELLEGLGVEVPIKVSPTTGKPTYAFSKNDPGWKDLEEEYAQDPIVAPILAARIGVKSTIAETRAQRLLDIAERHGRLRVPLRYYAAHTGRYGGMELINCQNLTRVNPKLRLADGSLNRNQLRFGLKAPPGYMVLASDLSQIEARLNAWLSGCNDLLHVFRTGGDPYAVFASKLFRRMIVKGVDDLERFIGKTCILGLGYGMGWQKLRATLRKDNIKASEQEATTYVTVYRSSYYQIPALWKFCDEAIEIIANGGRRQIGPCLAEHSHIILPNGMTIEYPKLRHVSTKKYEGWYYTFAEQGRTLWGGKVVENIIQSLARIIIMSMMRRIRRETGYRPALQAHDELVYIVPIADVQNAVFNKGKYEGGSGLIDHVLGIMRTPPGFALDLPIDAEINFGPTYGDAK